MNLQKYNLKDYNSVSFIDTEITIESKKIKDFGAVRMDGAVLHTGAPREFFTFIADSKYVCGHNIIHFDLEEIQKIYDVDLKRKAIDTLYLSPLLFPKRPYHSLVKDDKLQTEELNNPVNDSRKAKELFEDEVNAFFSLPLQLRQIYYGLLYSKTEFTNFFKYIEFAPLFLNVKEIILNYFQGKICAHKNLDSLIQNHPLELAYALALINADDNYSITPFWLTKNFPEIENIIKLLRNTPCEEGCAYCESRLDVNKALKSVFGFDSFRSYKGVPLQEGAAKAAVGGKSLLAIFPTGGGKSITFQLPALMAGMNAHGLTVVISPLQSLMKDQVDNLERQGIVDAVTINGMLSSVERANAMERIMDGTATLLYISPEQLRSKTIEHILMARNVVRFVIDEAHCFSAWGQDFRVDYLYIGEFIRNLQKAKGKNHSIPVSCFTATAKQKVISDIFEYFQTELEITLELFASDADRENLHYKVLYKDTDAEKYNALRSLILAKKCPSIVYVSRTKKTMEIAEKLREDGISARAFHGKMEPSEKIANQEAFIQDEVQVIVATSAFGMGVDKKDVGLVIHYDISDSLENYLQEAGRAGRDQSLDADCFILYNDGDLDKHFMLLNQTKLSLSEIQQIWRAIKNKSGNRKKICYSALEIARAAGWDEEVMDIEGRVRTAIACLERAGYIKRGYNIPHVYANSILVRNMIEAGEKIDASHKFSEEQNLYAKRIIKSLISKRSQTKGNSSEAESRVDYLADILGIEKKDVIETVDLLREIHVLSDDTDMTAYIRKSEAKNKSLVICERFAKLERYLLEEFSGLEKEYSFEKKSYKELNESAAKEGIAYSSVKNIKTIIYFWMIKGYAEKPELFSKEYPTVHFSHENNILLNQFEQRIQICKIIISYLYEKSSMEGLERTESAEENQNKDNQNKDSQNKKEEGQVLFSINELLEEVRKQQFADARQAHIEEALLYLSKIEAMILEGGFLVSYNGMEITRLNMNNQIKYKISDYKSLDEYYKQKIQQIHIVGEYANMMVRDYNAALDFVHDYFQLDYKKFIAKYFKDNRQEEINRNITPAKYAKLFGSLSETQHKIIDDHSSNYIVVAAGPGSGKTKLLVHKLAALLQMEDVKHEQLLMLTFSRAAATEFKTRLYDLIGNAAAYVDIKTFHSYSFDLLGKVGSIESSENIVRNAADMIMAGEVEPGKITKSVLVIDEAQDMDRDAFDLVKALMSSNDEMRVIAVGDDDQNIYAFRGSDSAYLKSLITDYHATKYELIENYRSRQDIVSFANRFAQKINDRMKTSDAAAVSGEKGMVNVSYHKTQNLEVPVVHEICDTYYSGSVCVITKTNEEALKIYGLLQRQGKQAKLIQSVEGFRLSDLQELRYFLKEIDEKLVSPVIAEDLWNETVEKLKTEFQGSVCLDNCLRLLSAFQTINRTKYRTDLEEFIRESAYEDFYESHEQIIYISTIHKSKGREFDTVYLMLKGKSMGTEEAKRAIYVALTRAKHNLFIHCNTTIFQNILTSNIGVVRDYKEYAEPTEMLVRLSHKDIYLDYCKNTTNELGRLRSGMKINYRNYFITYRKENGEEIKLARISQRFQRQLEYYAEKGFYPEEGTIEFIVSWKGQEDTKEIWIPLVSLKLTKKNLT